MTKEREFSKVCARWWYPCLLSHVQKRILSTGNIGLFEADEGNNLVCFITMDRRWVHHFQPEEISINNQSSRNSYLLLQKKATDINSVGKVVASVYVCTEANLAGILFQHTVKDYSK